jgi:hypothetical protein
VGAVRRAILAALPLLMLAGGCSSAASTPGVTAPSSGVPWIVVDTGSATPSPAPTALYGSASPFPSGFLPLPSGVATPTPTVSATCTSGRFQGGIINYASVVVGTTSAVVTWNNPGGDGLVQYRVTAIGQDVLPGLQRDVGWTVVTPVAGTCGVLSATVKNLSRKKHYVFSVDAVFTRIGQDGTRAATIARSESISTN